jgi:hypothetical protein
MKKIILCGLLAISILSCKKENTDSKTEVVTETKNDSLIVEKMTVSEITDTLKKGEFATTFAKYSDEVVTKIAQNMSYMLTMDETGEQEYLKEINHFENDMISLYWETCGTGGCVNYQTLQIKDNQVIDLGTGYSKLSADEVAKLDAAIKAKVKNFSHISGRNENTISIAKNGNYLIGIRGLTDEDGEATGGSIEISYETKDLTSYIPSTLKVTM